MVPLPTLAKRPDESRTPTFSFAEKLVPGDRLNPHVAPAVQIDVVTLRPA